MTMILEYESHKITVTGRHWNSKINCLGRPQKLEDIGTIKKDCLERPQKLEDIGTVNKDFLEDHRDWKTLTK